MISVYFSHLHVFISLCLSLAAQLRSVQLEMEGAEQRKEEEVLSLQQAVEEYELETVTLRAEIAMKSQRRDEERKRDGKEERCREER